MNRIGNFLPFKTELAEHNIRGPKWMFDFGHLLRNYLKKSQSFLPY